MTADVNADRTEPLCPHSLPVAESCSWCDSDDPAPGNVLVGLHYPGAGKPPVLIEGPFRSRAELEAEWRDFGIDDRDEVVEMTGEQYETARGEWS